MNIIRRWTKQTLDYWTQRIQENKQPLLFMGYLILSMVISYGLGLLRIHEGISHDWGSFHSSLVSHPVLALRLM